MTPKALYLSDIGYDIGRQRDIDTLTKDADVSQHLDRLLGEGIEHYRLSSLMPAELAARSCRLSAVGSTSVRSAVVYCTDSPACMTLTDDLWEFLSRADIPERHAVVAGGAGCGNLGPGLAVARGLLATGDYDEVLLVTTDRVNGSTRFVGDGLTVLSDGAASCRITMEPPETGFRISGMASKINARTPPPGRKLANARNIVAVLADLLPKAFRNATAPAGESRFLLTGNYGATPRNLLGMAAGLPAEAHYAPRVAEIGHCFSADILIGLADLARTNTLSHGDQLITIMSSPKAWSVLAVDYYRPSLSNLG